MKILFSVILVVEVLCFLSEAAYHMFIDSNVLYSPVGDALVYGLLAALVCLITIVIIDYSLMSALTLMLAPIGLYFAVWRILK